MSVLLKHNIIYIQFIVILKYYKRPLNLRSLTHIKFISFERNINDIICIRVCIIVCIYVYKEQYKGNIVTIIIDDRRITSKQQSSSLSSSFAFTSNTHCKCKLCVSIRVVCVLILTVFESLLKSSLLTPTVTLVDQALVYYIVIIIIFLFPQMRYAAFYLNKYFFMVFHLYKKNQLLYIL